MKYLSFFFKKLGQCIKAIFGRLFPIVFIVAIFVLSFISEGYTLEDLGIYDISLNPFDYCNITDVDYTAVLNDSPDGSASVDITEYLTFDVHAASRNNTFKELWRELPEDEVDGLRVTYDVKSVSQVLDDGSEIPYTETSKMYWEDEDYTEDATYYWHHSKGSGKYPDDDESVLIYIPWTYREKMVFKIEYTMNNAALKYNDCSELYLSMYSGNTITKLKSHKSQILIPDRLMPSSYYVYTFGTAKTRLECEESDSINPDYTTFTMNLTEDDLKFNYHNRYIEFCLLSYGDDKHIFTKYAPDNYYTGDDALEECIAEDEHYKTLNEKFNDYKTVILVLAIMISIVLIIDARNIYIRIKEKYDIFTPEVDYDDYREIPSDLDPIFASELVFMKDSFDSNKEKQEEYAAILLSLVKKQYVKITKVDESRDWSDSNTSISLENIVTTSTTSPDVAASNYSPEPVYTTVNQDTGYTLEPLTVSERLYMELLERHIKNHNNSLTISQFQTSINLDYVHTDAFVKDMEKKPILEAGVLQGYFQNAKYDEPKKKLEASAKTSLTFAILFLIFVNAISYFTPMALSFGAYTVLGMTCLWKYFYLSFKTNNLYLFTQYGANEQAKWYGLYKFLNSDTLINEREVHELPLWEKYLIYATAFGISEKVVKAIKIHATEINIDNSPILNHHCYIHSAHFHTTSKSFGHSLHTASRGGGFSGHGYGGGGRGGGGGGGGH